MFVTLFSASLAHANFAKINISDAKVMTDNGSAFSSKIDLIAKAESNLDLSYFIIDNDHSSSLLLQKILDKVAQSRSENKKLQVRILVDYFMSEKQLPTLRLLAANPEITVKRYGKPSAEWKKAMTDLGINGPLFVSSLMAQNGAGIKESIKDAKLGPDAEVLNDIPNGEKKNPFQWVSSVVAKVDTVKAKIDATTTKGKLFVVFAAGLVDFLHRTHHKLLLVDGNCFQMGGRNLSDEYHADVSDVLIQGNDKIEKRPYAFNDLDIKTCLAQKVAYGSSPMTASFEALWNSPRNVNVTQTKDFYTEAESKATITSVEELAAKAQEAEFLLGKDKLATEIKADATTAVYVENKEITEFYIRALDSLEKGDEAVFANAYFFQDIKWLRSEAEPLKRLYRAFIRAGKAGAKVKVFTNSIKTTDLNIVNAFAYPEYRKLAEAGVQLIELSDKQGPAQLRSSLHMKGGYYLNKNGLKVIVGSYNLDPRSHARDTNNALIVWVPKAQQDQVKADLDSAINTTYVKDITKLSWLPITVEGDENATNANLEALEKVADEEANKQLRKTLLPFKIEI
jgi:phosphatidylserine/phosphatidylglycerophosphate/cardiolipin synthase-like enzyme